MFAFVKARAKSIEIILESSSAVELCAFRAVSLRKEEDKWPKRRAFAVEKVGRRPPLKFKRAISFRGRWAILLIGERERRQGESGVADRR